MPVPRSDLWREAVAASTCLIPAYVYADCEPRLQTLTYVPSFAVGSDGTYVHHGIGPGSRLPSAAPESRSTGWRVHTGVIRSVFRQIHRSLPGRAYVFDVGRR